MSNKLYTWNAQAPTVGRILRTWLQMDRDGSQLLRVLDTETTGLGPDDEVIEVAVLSAQGAVLYEKRWRPRVPISNAAQAVHHINGEELLDCPFAEDEWPTLAGYLSGARVVTYNAEFDQRMLHQTADHAKLSMPICEWGCLKELYARLGNDAGRYVSLDVVCERLGIDRHGHTAVGDARAALTLLHRLAEGLPRSKAEEV